MAGQGTAGPERSSSKFQVISASTATFKAADPVTRLRAFRGRVRYLLDRPLTPYYLILGSALLLLVLGLGMVFSSSQILAKRWELPMTFFFRKQLIAVLLGLGLMVLFARTPLKLMRATVYPVLFGVLGALVLVAVPGIGKNVGGNQNWLDLGFFQVQPSEFAKLALVLWAADLLARKQKTRTLDQWKHLLVPLVPGTLLLVLLIMAGGDMGTTMILIAMLFGLLWLVGAPLRLFAATLGIAVVACTALIITVPHRLDRLACIGVTKPDPNVNCFQALHGLYAFAAGGPFGSGFGAGVEKWGQLPEAHTDFIFAALGEELGLVGTLSVLGLFAALGYAGIRVASSTKDPFVRYAAGAATTWIMAQAMVNLGSALGLLPIAGVPLPLFSYGGSAMLSAMSAVGVLLCFARSSPGAKAALAARPLRIKRWANSRFGSVLTRVLPRRTTAREAAKPKRRER
ncbi:MULTISPECIES: putative lipid II flippase FtsW [unclassified Kitasatospora]|uniref:putative lipid II flippase FtsW n=1 Tax=unclassified Kitasatospora TaxID=2633591 RepID=UPI00071038A7|nr:MULTISPECIES: putative lipid II flippase FtsW [unclassified Kitasatospora]KQV16889.1 cell division protein FtsW [Kitasatospora sp. Root107]KRB73668.1 cell division protein FtsW [Kitasatospora sp. Root187]